MNKNMQQYLDKAEVLIELCRISSGSTERSSL